MGAARTNFDSTRLARLLKILYYTAGLTGSGNTVIGISIANALRRKKLESDYLLLHNNPGYSGLAERLQVPSLDIPFESEQQLSRESYPSSALYQAIVSFDPDVLIVNLHWFVLHHFIETLSCRKIFLCRQVANQFFRISTSDGDISIRPDDYDLLLATEPWDPPFPMRSVNPIIIRNREEILSRTRAREHLRLPPEDPCCLFTFTGSVEEVAEVKRMFAYLSDEGYRMVYATDHPAGLFPAVDYFNAVDYLICGAGYNAFWEAVYFQKEAYFIPLPRNFEDQRRRVAECQDHLFEENGADQLVELLLQL